MHGVGGDLHRNIGGETLRGRGDESEVGLTPLSTRGGGVHHQPGGLGFHRHIGEHELHALVVGDRAAELLAVLGVRDRRIQCTLGDTDRLRADGGPGVVKGGQCGLEPGTGFADDAVARNTAVLEVQLGGG